MAEKLPSEQEPYPFPSTAPRALVLCQRQCRHPWWQGLITDPDDSIISHDGVLAGDVPAHGDVPPS